MYMSTRCSLNDSNILHVSYHDFTVPFSVIPAKLLLPPVYKEDELLQYNMLIVL